MLSAPAAASVRLRPGTPALACVNDNTLTICTQVVGPAGLGKTQLCLQLAVMGCLEREAEGGAVAFIDTEQKFSARR